MPWPAPRIELKPSAAKDLGRLPREVQVRIARRLDQLGQDPRPHGCEKVEGEEDLYRVRVGDYRLIYAVQDKVLLVLVVKIGNRREVYR
jgi:mRNA interferase RelE/StbE